MPVNLVSDADIRAISIVGKGANRKRFFLFKSGEKGGYVEGCPSLPPGRLLKSEDWSTVYCVVAEPGAHEDSGMGGPDIEDRWASEEEIRKAAHRFMKNGGLINRMHEDLEPFGDLVENAIALDDLAVGGQVIRKGSWYIAITPNAEGKAAIEKGEFTGVSIEGLARRTEVEKGSTRAERTVGSVKDQGLLRKIAEAVGLSAEEVEAVEKGHRTFGQIITQREFDEVLPDAFEAFRDAVWYAFFNCDDSDETPDPKALIVTNCDEFKAWCLDQLDSLPVQKSERAAALGVTLKGSTPIKPTLNSEDDMGLTADENKRIEKLETDLASAAEGISKLTDSVAEIAKAVKPEPEAPTVETVAESVTKLTEGLEGIKSDIAKLGEGGSSQTDGNTENEGDKPDAEAIRKAFEGEGVKPELAGVL